MSGRFMVALWAGCFAMLVYQALDATLAGNVVQAVVAWLSSVAEVGIGHLILRSGEAS